MSANADNAAAQPQTENASDEEVQPASTSGRPACFVITHSVSKRHNVGTIARCATAFGVKAVCLVGSRQFNTFGSHGADIHVAFRHYANLDGCCRALREEGCSIVGVEIAPDALPVQSHPFKGPTAFMLGNEGQGLSPKQMALCDSFVYIPQHGAGTASLNVAVAASIVLHHFALWAGYAEREREGHKFVVAERPLRTTARGVVADSDTGDLQAERKARQAAAEVDWLMEGDGGAEEGVEAEEAAAGLLGALGLEDDG